jgi:hypothetical protein
MYIYGLYKAGDEEPTRLKPCSAVGRPGGRKVPCVKVLDALGIKYISSSEAS